MLGGEATSHHSHATRTPRSAAWLSAFEENTEMKPNVSVACPWLMGAAAMLAACSSSSSTTDAGSPDDAGPDAVSMSTVDAADAGPPDTGVPDTSPGDSGTGFVPSNVPLASFPADIGDVTVSATGCVADTDKLTVDCVSHGPDGGLPYVFVAAMQTDGSPVAVLAVNSLSVSPSASLSVKGSAPLLVWARTTVNIQGSFIADPAFHPTNGGGAIETQSGTGGGPGGGGPGLSNPEVGGGGGGYCGTGGTGANSQIVAIDAGAPVPGGRAYGTAAIVPLIGGSSGGAPLSVGGGGEGGGSIEITAGASIIIGSGGAVSVPGYGGTGNGGGGGSGGAILLEAPSVTVDGVLAANGGGGAVFSGGGGAQDGQPSAHPAAGQDANSAVGSAGAQLAGADGAATQSATSSGGGGAGRIRINSATGMATIGATAIVSPSLTTTCATQGTLMMK